MFFGGGFISSAAMHSAMAEKLRRRGYDEADIEEILFNYALSISFAVIAAMFALFTFLTASSVRLIPVIFGAMTVIFAIAAVCFYLNYREYKHK